MPYLLPQFSFVVSGTERTCAVPLTALPTLTTLVLSSLTVQESVSIAESILVTTSVRSSVSSLNLIFSRSVFNSSIDLLCSRLISSVSLSNAARSLTARSRSCLSTSQAVFAASLSWTKTEKMKGLEWLMQLVSNSSKLYAVIVCLQKTTRRAGRGSVSIYCKSKGGFPFSAKCRAIVF